MLVSLLFIPIYYRELGDAQFGIVAVILSLQSLLVTLDLGISTFVSREFARGGLKNIRHRVLLRNIEVTIGSIYTVAIVAIAVFVYVGPAGSTDSLTLYFSALLFGALVLQNIHYVAVIAKQFYASASIIYFSGNIARAALTAVVVSSLAPTVQGFLATQLLVAVIHTAVMRHYSWRLISPETAQKRSLWPLKINQRQFKSLLGRTKGLAVISVAGAAVTQLDKPIISALLSAQDVTPYFLAMTICLVPMSVFAAPVFQYFQPKIVNSILGNKPDQLRRDITLFSQLLFVATISPALVLWFFTSELLSLWLGLDPANQLISEYIHILLPGLTIGALGFIPFSLLLAAKDYRFQAVTSVTLAAATLIAVLIACLNMSVASVCIAYVAFHIGSTAIPWIRATLIDQTRAAALTAGANVLVALAMIIALVALSEFYNA